MRSRVCLLVALFVVVAVPLAPTPTAEAERATFWDAILREWNAPGPLPQTQAFMLAPDEDYLRYSFALETAWGDEMTSPTGGYLFVRHTSTGDVICQGPVGHTAGVRVYLACDDLRIGNSYLVTYESTLPSDLVLYAAYPAP